MELNYIINTYSYIYKLKLNIEKLRPMKVTLYI